MKQRTKVLLRDSFALVAPNAEEAAALFYGRVFELDPSLQTMSPEVVSDQGRKLMQMLAAAVKGLDRIEQLIPALEQLAVRHVGYGVKTEHYETVGQALFWTLQEGLGEAFTDEVLQARDDVCELISGVMIDAAEASEVVVEWSLGVDRCPYHGSYVGKGSTAAAMA
jgi:hemoglobin-like flavoprotein